MATYPNFPILVESRITRVDGYEPRRATNGLLKVRKMMAGEQREFMLVHFLNKTDKGTLETFFQTNKTLDVTFNNWPGDATSYPVRFTAAPQFDQEGSYWYRATVRLSQVYQA